MGDERTERRSGTTGIILIKKVNRVTVQNRGTVIKKALPIIGRAFAFILVFVFSLSHYHIRKLAN
jgi:hypothetical protein